MRLAVVVKRWEEPAAQAGHPGRAGSRGPRGPVSPGPDVRVTTRADVEALRGGDRRCPTPPRGPEFPVASVRAIASRPALGRARPTRSGTASSQRGQRRAWPDAWAVVTRPRVTNARGSSAGRVGNCTVARATHAGPRSEVESRRRAHRPPPRAGQDGRPNLRDHGGQIDSRAPRVAPRKGSRWPRGGHGSRPIGPARAVPLAPRARLGVRARPVSPRGGARSGSARRTEPGASPGIARVPARRARGLGPGEARSRRDFCLLGRGQQDLHSREVDTVSAQLDRLLECGPRFVGVRGDVREGEVGV